MSGRSRARVASLCAIAVGLALTMSSVAAQDPSPQARATANRTERAVRDARTANPNLRVKIEPRTGLPARISGLASRNSDLPAIGASEPSRSDIEQAVRRFFVETPMGLAFPQISASVDDSAPRANAPIEYAPSNVRADPDFPGQYVAQVEQRVGGVPVFGSSAKLTLNRSLDVTQLTASFSAAPISTTEPQISEADAVQSARTALSENLQAHPGDDPFRGSARVAEMPATASVTVFDPAVLRTIAPPGPARLAWLVTIASFRIFIDAQNRAVLHLYRDQHSNLTRKVFDLSGGTTHPGVAVFDESTSLTAPDPGEDAKLAFENSRKVYDYFKSKFGRDSFDDSDGDGPLGGSALESNVRYGTIKNAFWCVRADLECPKADVMIYGPGYAGALDVVGHEMTHGIIAHEANLVYDSQPGAVNESLADIFGTLIEHEQGGGNWTIGESLPGFSAAVPLRSLADPHLTGPDGVSHFDKNTRYAAETNRGQPDHMSDLMNRTHKLCSSTGDFFNGCVHFNSGILNKAAFLISQGGTHRGVTVSGIGDEKLGRIAYRALTTKLNSASDFSDTGDAFLLSCTDFSNVGQFGFVAADCINVEKAFQAVGLVAGS